MFTTDNRTENFLTQIGVHFEYKNGIKFPVDMATGWHEENIGRPVAVRDEAVLEYATLMGSGSAAPAPILIQSSSGLRVLDGVQRLCAAELSDTTRISAYVVSTDSEDVIATIRVLANARLQGRAEPPEWTRRRAVEVLVLQRGMSTSEVASMGGWKKSDIDRISTAIELQERVTQCGGPVLPDNILASLSSRLLLNDILEKAAKPVAGFLHLIRQSKLSASDAEPFIEEFFQPIKRNDNPYKTYAERLHKFREDPEIATRMTGRKGTEIPLDVSLIRTLKAAETIAKELIASGGPVNNVDEYFLILKRIRKELMSSAPNRKPVSARVPADMWENVQ